MNCEFAQEVVIKKFYKLNRCAFKATRPSFTHLYRLIKFYSTKHTKTPFMRGLLITPVVETSFTTGHAL